MATKHNKPPLQAEEIIYKQAKGSICRQALCTVGLLGSTSGYDRNGFLFCTATINGELWEVFSTLL